jgi:hypothetical protein
VPWALVNVGIAGGLHTLQFVYDKTGATAGGSDAAWLDALNFPANTPSVQTVSVSRQGTGAGTITSQPTGLDCGPTCSFLVTTGMPVALDATVQPGARFEGWSGACTGTGLECTLRVTAPTNAAATFIQFAGTHKKTVASW